MPAMYSVSSIEGTRWRIIDGSQRLVFVGTKQQAEDWLDARDNMASRPSTLAKWLHGLMETSGRPLIHVWSAARAQVVRRAS
jgi:hypothetical protein